MRKETVEKIKKFLEGVEEFKVERFILFGSRVRGDHLKTSDLDIIIVSKDFSEVKFPERANIFYEKWQGDPDLDFICYTPQEIKKKMRYKGLISTAMEQGIEVGCRAHASSTAHPGADWHQKR